MPPPSAYTPFESLLFFQSLAALDSRPTSFASISNTLRNNSFIRQNAAFNPDRLSPEALEELYTTLIRDGLTAAGTLATSEHNGRADTPVATNPKKRKISSPRPENPVDGVPHATIVPDLVSRLYARYKDLVTREIKDEEQRFAEIRYEIQRLQEEEQEATTSAAVYERATQRPPAKQEPAPGPTDISTKAERLVQQPTRHANDTHAVPTPEPGIEGLQLDQSLPGLASPQLPATTAPPKTGKEQQPQLPQATRLSHELAGQPSHPVPAAPFDQITPSANGKAPSSRQRPNVEPQRTPVSEGPAKVSPVPHSQQQTSYSAMPSHTPIPQPSHHVLKEPVYPTDSQQAAKTEAGMPTTPGPSTPVHTPAPVGHGQGYGPATAGTETPLQGTRGAPPPPLANARRSLTPWKKLPRLSIPDRPSSPVRPQPEDISPISDRVPSPVEHPEIPAEGIEPRRRKRRAADEKEPNVPSSDVDRRASKRAKVDKPAPATRKRRDGSTPSPRSRQSVVSREERSPTEPPLDTVKHEAANTPASIPEDIESSARAGLDRKGGAAAAQTGRRLGRGRSKRKRSVTEPLELEPTQPESSRVDPNQYVLCARNFPRTGAPIMNDVTTHKHASIFTKPLTEREAPGYRDLIYRPQDLKSIKSSITQGSKAVAAASENAGTPTVDGESPAPAAGTPSKNAVLMLRKSEDIVPPRAIVNSAQLEKELIRLFANAVMYNPTPQRGFGPAFPMISDSGSRASSSVPETDEGGVVNDAMEMFEEVEKAVTRWRAAERPTDELGHKGVLSGRRGSAVDLNTDSADDNKA